LNWIRKKGRNTVAHMAPLLEVKSNDWLYYSEADTAFVFIHGVLSSPQECWRSNAGEFWPTLIFNDETFKRPAIFMAAYHTAITSNRYDITQCVKEVLQGLKLPKGVRKSPLTFKNIVFVCHSLGGVVCRRLLEENASYFDNKNVAVVLMASPTLGSKYAKFLQKVAKTYGHKIAKQLLPNSDALKDIDERFRSLIDKNNMASLVGAEAVEHHGPLRFGFLPCRTPPVVGAQSASRYFGSTRIIPETDHFTIVKPASVDSQSHKFLQEFYIEKFASCCSPPAPEFNVTGKPDPLFEVYRPCHSRYYINRDADDLFAKSISTTSVWVTGKSGVGKTSIVRRWLGEQGVRPVEVTLAHTYRSIDFQTDIINELLASLQARGFCSDVDGFFGLVQAIKKCAEQCVVPVFVDEIPVSEDQSGDDIARFFGVLLDAVKRDCSPNVNIIICSIRQPTDGSIPGKMREQMRFVHLNEWASFEVEKLFDMIALTLGVKDDLAHYRPKIITCSGGSPRLVKDFFRRIKVSEKFTDDGLDEALEQASAALRGLN
jgi:hypothetical protein